MDQDGDQQPWKEVKKRKKRWVCGVVEVYCYIEFLFADVAMLMLYVANSDHPWVISWLLIASNSYTDYMYVSYMYMNAIKLCGSAHKS